MTFLNYYDSAEGETVDEEGVFRLFRQHGIPESDWSDFFVEHGQKSQYDAQAVLRWLGY